MKVQSIVDLLQSDRAKKELGASAAPDAIAAWIEKVSKEAKFHDELSDELGCALRETFAHRRGRKSLTSYARKVVRLLSEAGLLRTPEVA